MEETREDIILAKMKKREEICITCKEYLEHRLPELIEEHGQHTGYCFVEGSEDCLLFTVNADSCCDQYDSIYSTRFQPRKLGNIRRKK